jgi:uncharacterized membrane protein
LAQGCIHVADDSPASTCDKVMRVKRFLIILGIIFLLAGTVGLLHPSFNYHKREEVAKLGPIQATVDEEKTVQIPVVASAAMMIAGLALLVLGPRMKP